MKYLIMRCDELNDQYECDADRTPITMTNNYENWFNKEQPDYQFEVYELKNGEFNLVKKYDEYMDEGMALYYFDKNDTLTVINKWSGRDRNDPIPDEVIKIFKARCYLDVAHDTIQDMIEEVKSCGHVGYSDDEEEELFYMYGHYWDNKYSSY